jgi:hypothetical protein
VHWVPVPPAAAAIMRAAAQLICLPACLPACLCASQAELARVAARDEAREERFREAQRCGAAYDHAQVLRPLRSSGSFGGL